MAEALVKLKKRAIKAGMKKSEAKSASRSELEDFLSNGSSSKKSTKSKGKAVKASKTKAKAKATKAKTKATKAEKPKATKTKAKKGDVGRREIGKVKFTGYDEDEWNPREGSAVEEIWKALKKNKGDVEKTFAALKARAKDFASSNKAPDGSRRTKEWFQKNLRYRINRTLFEFAVKTGQHEVATNRAEYGSGDYAQSSKKAKRNSSKSSKSSKTKAKSTKASKGKKTSKKK